MSYFPCDIPFMTVDELIENGIHTPKDVSSTNIENTGFISIREALDAVEESRRLNHHKDAKEACAHEYEHRHFLKILMDIQPADVVPVSAYKQVMWERDVAVEQLKQIGKGLGEAMDDVTLVAHGWVQK